VNSGNGVRVFTSDVLKRLSKSDKIIIAGNAMLDHDLRKFIQSLNDTEVRYLIVGRYTFAVHGYPRYAKDVDI
jgi:cupin superfamily acireductone dioxygenase involved in methionine salvage